MLDKSEYEEMIELAKALAQGDEQVPEEEPMPVCSRCKRETAPDEMQGGLCFDCLALVEEGLENDYWPEDEMEYEDQGMMVDDDY